jgi:hypothetical protein
MTKKIFAYYFFSFTSFFKDKKSSGSHKTAGAGCGSVPLTKGSGSATLAVLPLAAFNRSGSIVTDYRTDPRICSKNILDPEHLPIICPYNLSAILSWQT